MQLNFINYSERPLKTCSNKIIIGYESVHIKISIRVFISNFV